MKIEDMSFKGQEMRTVLHHLVPQDLVLQETFCFALLVTKSESESTKNVRLGHQYQSNQIDGEIMNVLYLHVRAVGRWFEVSRGFFTALRSKRKHLLARNQDNVSEWSDMSYPQIIASVS